MGNEISNIQCFFITPIGDSDSPIRKHADEILNNYLMPIGQELSVQIVRGDSSTQPGSIMRQVVEWISQCSVVVADLTGFNPNVMYELALAHSFRKPTVLIQRTASNDRLPFDVVQERIIQFDPSLTVDRERARIELKSQMQACLNGGIDTPVSTALDLFHIQNLPDGKEMTRTLEKILHEVKSIQFGSALSELINHQSNINPTRLVDLGREIEKLLSNINKLESITHNQSDESISNLLSNIKLSSKHIEDIAESLGPSKIKKIASLVKTTEAIVKSDVAELALNLFDDYLNKNRV
jgi:hypothetical protein